MEHGGQPQSRLGEEATDDREPRSFPGHFWDWLGEETKQRQRQLAIRAQEMYDEGRPLFTREMIADAQRQIDQLQAGTMPPGKTLSVIGMDGVRYDNPRREIDLRKEPDHVPVMTFTSINSLTDLSGRVYPCYGSDGVVPINIATASSDSSYVERVEKVTADQVAAALDAVIDSFSGRETWRSVKSIFDGADLSRLEIDKIVAFGLGVPAREALPGVADRPSCMQHALLLALAALLEEKTGRRVRRIAQEPEYFDSCKQVLRARDVEVAEPETGFLLVDEKTLVLTVACNVPVMQIVTELARPAGMIWARVEPDEKPRQWWRDEDGGWISPHITDPSSPRVRELVKGYTEYTLTPIATAELCGSAVYLRKES
ncbi:hypothetical protein O9K51_05641 [Purpureocillium lavendulum]|uniref:SRR1-like domain-containing protein n=1 Tax=Purpureocillium lavendulum TaxID=1247861 RepID=A0AB34FRT4_9HYPO|nr:hypothetical protein O9K51_05641 [Purpureocillium lavendulum]